MLPKILIYLLRPFAGPINYITLKIMKRFRQPDDNRPVIATSDYLIQKFILPSAFTVFKDEKFRQLANFDQLPVTEHDRLFNELEVTAIWLTICYLRAVKSLVRPQDYHFWQKVELHLPRQFQHFVLGFGVQGDNAKLLKQLIEMRGQEYDEMAKYAYDVNVQENSEFNSLPDQMQGFAADIQAMAFGTASHIRRGKIEHKDPLTAFLISWLMDLRLKIAKFIKKL